MLGKTKAGPDPRHHAVLVEIMTLYQKANGVEMPCPGRVAKALKAYLAENRKWKAEALVRAVENRFASDGVNPAEEPWCWVKYLARYVNGPLDKWGKPLRGARCQVLGVSRKPTAEDAAALERMRNDFERTFGKKL